MDEKSLFDKRVKTKEFNTYSNTVNRIL